MANTKGIKAGRAYVELGVNDLLAKGFKAAQAQLTAFGTSITKIGAGITAVGAAAIGPLGAAVKVFQNQGDALDEMSARTGFTAEALSSLGHAASLSGASLEAVETGVRKMQKTLVAAECGAGASAEAFAKLGLSAKDLLALSPEKQFETIAEQLSKIGDPTRRAAAAMEIFGKSGTKLLPILSGGAKGIADIRSEADRLGITFSGKAAKDAGILADAMDTLRNVTTATAAKIGGALAPAITKVIKYITPIVSGFNKWVEQNQALIVTIAKVALGVAAVGAVVTGLGVAIVGLGAVFGGLSSILATATTVAGGISAAFLAMLNPVNILAAGCVAATAAVIYFSGTGGQAIDWLKEQFVSLKELTGTVITGISDALAAGDISLAATVLWNGLKVAWEKGTLELRKIWETTTGFFKGIFFDAFSSVLNIGQTIFHGLEIAWIETTAALSSSWQTFTSFITETWLTAANIVEKTWNFLKGIFDSTFDSAAANIKADQDLVAKLAENQSQKDSAKGAIEERRKFERDTAAAIDAGTKEAIAKAHVDALDKMEKDGAARISAAQAELDAANKALTDSTSKAKAAKEEAKGKSRPEFEKFDEQLAAAGAATASKASTVGTFNARNIGQLVGGDAINKTAENTKETADNTAKMMRYIQKIPLIWN